MSIDLDAIQARVDAATEGPWKSSDFGYPGDEEPSSIVIHQGAFNWKAIEDGEYLAALPAWDSQEGADAEFIANARTDVPALLAYARDLEARIGRVEALIENTDDTVVTQADGVHVPVYLVRAALTATEDRA